MFEVPKLAVSFWPGTLPVDQLEPVSKSFDPGFCSQVAFAIGFSPPIRISPIRQRASRNSLRVLLWHADSTTRPVADAIICRSMEAPTRNQLDRAERDVAETKSIAGNSGAHAGRLSRITAVLRSIFSSPLTLESLPRRRRGSFQKTFIFLLDPVHFRFASGLDAWPFCAYNSLVRYLAGRRGKLRGGHWSIDLKTASSTSDGASCAAARLFARSSRKFSTCCTS